MYSMYVIVTVGVKFYAVCGNCPVSLTQNTDSCQDCRGYIFYRLVCIQQFMFSVRHSCEPIDFSDSAIWIVQQRWMQPSWCQSLCGFVTVCFGMSGRSRVLFYVKGLCRTFLRAGGFYYSYQEMESTLLNHVYSIRTRQIVETLLW